MSCVATAGGYYQRNQTEKHFRHPEWDLGDPRYRFSPKICYRFGGVGFADKVQQALWVWGSVDWAELPFTPERITEYPSPAQLEAAKPYRTGGYAAIWNRMGATYPLVPPNPIDQAKAWLAEGYTLSVDINPENPHYPDNGPGHVPYNPYFDPGFITGTPGHGVAIVGYDDDANPYGTTPDHRGGFLVVNSHGPDWNGPMKGFVWMSYDYAKRFVTYAWIQLPGAPDEPVITGASQRELNVGDSVTLTGHGFGALRRSAGVTFNGVLATDVSFTDEAVTATVPAGATSGPVVVSNGNGIPSNPFHLDLAVLPPVRILPIVLDVTSGTARFTTEVTLTNRGRKAVSAALRYQVSLGGPAGSGEVTEPLAAGEQEVIPDVLAFLRTKGLPIPAGNQGGQLIVRFIGADGESVVAASARTTTPAASPGPEGTLGLAYAAVPPSHLTGFGPLTVFGLRSNATDRSNLAVFNPQPAPVRVKVTAYDGKGSENLFEVIRDEETIPPYGWVQYSGVLDWSVSGQGWVTVEPLIPGSPFGVYGVVNDNTTHDGSFLPPSPADLGGGRMTVPVLVETATLSSELVLANNGGFEAYLTLQFGERTSGTPGVTFILYPKKQLIIPDAIEQLRKWHLPIGPRGAADYAGALHLTVRRAQNGHIFAAARTTSGSSAGGRVGVFTPAVVESQMASTETYLHGLKADARTRTNVALVNTGLFEEGPVALELRAFDGDAGGAESGQPQVVVLGPGAWRQLDGFLEQQGVANGWVRVARVVGSAPWLAYAVVNDGAAPGAGSGDGAYVAMSGPQP
ncbi:MAG: IPT/TIG domain-containing protein [Holophagales bacterium]|nr:IPT/TIG domain-containing protein [Holophagales bacterium]